MQAMSQIGMAVHALKPSRKLLRRMLLHIASPKRRHTKGHAGIRWLLLIFEPGLIVRLRVYCLDRYEEDSKRESCCGSDFLPH